MNNLPDQKSYTPQETPCLICGSQNCTVGESVSQWVYLRSDRAGWKGGDR